MNFHEKYLKHFEEISVLCCLLIPTENDVKPGFITLQMPRPRHKSKANIRLSSHPSR